MPATWTAKGQRQWLIERVPEFKAAQRARRGVKKFYKRTYIDFFERWPNQDTEEHDPPAVPLTKKGKVSQRKPQTEPREVKKFATTEAWMRDREDKIWHWFYNYTAKGSRGKARLKFKINVGAASKPKVMSEENLYSKKYYTTRVKAKVEAELKDVDDMGMRIAITKRCLREAWKSETQATKMEIRNLRKKLVQQKKASDEALERIFAGEQVPEDVEPEQYLLTQECLDEIIDEILDLIATRTGWAASLIVGGPDMSKVNGEITVKTYHVGNPKGDHTFWSDTPNYDALHAKPFREWCRRFFPEAVRLRRAVDIEMKNVKDPQALVDAGREPGHLIYVDCEDTPEEIAAREAREAAETARQEKTSENEGKDATGDGDSDEDVERNPSEADGEGENNREDSEDKEGQMEWVIENGVPVPIFVENDPGRTLAPTTPALGHAAQRPEDDNQPLSVNQSADSNRPIHPPSPTDAPKPGDSTAQTASFFPLVQDTFSFSPASNIFGPQGSSWNTGAEYGWPQPALQSSFGNAMVGGGFMHDFMAEGSCRGGGAGPRDVQGDVGGGVWVGDGGGYQGFGLFHDAWNGDGGMGTHFDFAGGPNLPNTHVQATWAQTAEVQNQATVRKAETAQAAQTIEATRPAMGGWSTQRGTGVVGGSNVMGGVGGATENETTKAGRSDIGGENKSAKRKRKTSKAPATSAAVEASSLKEDVVVRKEKQRVGEEVDDSPHEANQRPKHARQTRQTQLEDLPDWIDQAKRHLEAGMKHEEWLRLVDTWYQFEKVWAGTGMSQSGRVQAQKRPAELGPWLQVPRQYDTTPKIDDIQAFADQWLEWWMSIQPACRKNDGGKLPRQLTNKMDVTLLKKGGALGVVVILIGLRWWGGCEEVADVWEEAVEDVAHVFRRFTSNVAC